MRHIIIAAAFALAACSTEPAPAAPSVISLAGEITRADYQTYREIPFMVPPGTHRISIDFTYDKDNRTVIDLGLRDPQGQRGWSGGNKSHIEIGDGDATPSYRRGPIQPGEWKLVLGIPNIRDGQTSHYEATVKLSAVPATPPHTLPPPITTPLSSQPGWYRGDFHMHTAHSDGSCDVEGTRSPCPAAYTFEAGRDGQLDFIAITDHNTITQLADIREQQARFPHTLLIPGTEVTTFYGHANAIGVTDFIDFQLGSRRLPTLAKLFDELSQQGAILSVNHPALPSGEVCMGCGWTAKNTDWSRVTAIEVINGSTLRTGGAEGPTSGIRFWDNLLKQGYHLTAIGGSDNHDATDRTGEKQSPIGKPATVVHAEELSMNGIIAGVKSGRVFVDAAGLPGAVLDMHASAAIGTVNMGGDLALAPGASAEIQVNTTNAPADAKLLLVSYNVDLTFEVTSGKMLKAAAALKPGAKSGYARPELRAPNGTLLLLGNPIYLHTN